MIDDLIHWAVTAPKTHVYTAMALSFVIGVLIINPRFLHMKGYRRAKRQRIGKTIRHEKRDYTGRKWHINRLFGHSNICGICLEPITNRKDATIDHIIPLSKGGADEITNMQLAHSDCNNKKGNAYGDSESERA